MFKNENSAVLFQKLLNILVLLKFFQHYSHPFFGESNAEKTGFIFSNYGTSTSFARTLHLQVLVNNIIICSCCFYPESRAFLQFACLCTA